MRDLFHSFRTYSAARAVTHLVPDSGSVDDLVQAIARRRDRPILVRGIPLTGNAPSGAWVPGATEDHIFYPSGASPTRRTAALCHELGHILLKHNPALHRTVSAELLMSIAPSLSPDSARAVLFRSGYSTREEAEAEHFGTLLAIALTERATETTWSESTRLSERLR